MKNKKYLKIKGVTYEYQTFIFTLTKSFDREIWASFVNGYLPLTDFNEKQQNEFSKLDEFIRSFIEENFKTFFKAINKNKNGYSMYRFSNENKWKIEINLNLNLNDNIIEIKRSI